MERRLTLISLVLISIISVSTRFYKLSNFGPWADERISIGIANGMTLSDPIKKEVFTNFDIKSENSVKNVLRATVLDNGNSSLYNMILHYWLILYGNTEYSARLLSAICSILIVPLGYLFAKEISNSNLFLITTTLWLSIDPILIQDSHEIRAYSMATLFSFISSYLLFLIVFNKSRGGYLYIFYSLFAFFSILSHYLTGYILLAHFIIFLFFKKDKTTDFKLIVCGMTVCLLFLFWLFWGGLKGFKMLNQQFSGWDVQISEGNPYLLPLTFKNVIAGWIQVFLQLFGIPFQDFGIRMRSFFVLILIPFTTISLSYFLKQDNEIRKKLIFLGILTFTKIIFATSAAFLQGHCRPFLVAYSVFSAPSAIILLAFSVYFTAQIKKVVFWFLFLFFSFNMFISIFPIYSDNQGNSEPRNRNPHFLAANTIAMTYQKNDTIRFANIETARLVNIYLPDSILIFQTIDSASGIKIQPIR
jgi:uncharacterized membrane protein